MERRKFSRELKLEAVNMIKARVVSFALAGRELEVHENVLCKWVHESLALIPGMRFQGKGR